MLNNQFVPPQNLNTAVLLMVFNRPDFTKQVFKEIRKAKPPRLYIAADGPREDRTDEDKKVLEVRNHVLNNINWKCEVRSQFQDYNLGCKYGPISAISWFFENEEMGIILEDDCLPSQSFFWFCEDLLLKYREDNRIGMVNGNNYQSGKKKDLYSYYFSIFRHSWGWATWRRVWLQYDPELLLWPKLREEQWLYRVLPNRDSVNYWKEKFDSIIYDKLDAWDYQLTFLIFLNNYLCITPSVNLVSNIGFGKNATHTFNKDHLLSNIKKSDISFPLNHPCIFFQDEKADLFTMRKVYGVNLYSQIKKNILKIPGAKSLIKSLKLLLKCIK